jgi:hypothetical protein
MRSPHLPHDKACLLEVVSQRRTIVKSNVVDYRAPLQTKWVQTQRYSKPILEHVDIGSTNDKPTTRLQDPEQLREKKIRVNNVLKDFQSGHCPECFVGERQRLAFIEILLAIGPHFLGSQCRFVNIYPRNAGAALDEAPAMSAVMTADVKDRGSRPVAIARGRQPGVCNAKAVQLFLKRHELSSRWSRCEERKRANQWVTHAADSSGGWLQASPNHAADIP